MTTEPSLNRLETKILPPPFLFKKVPLNFDKKEPWKHDKLERRPIAERLNDIIDDIKQPFVMTLCGRYGSGKTTFAQSWRWDLENNGTRTVYFNAWESDYSSDAFAAFVNVVSKSINEPETKKLFLDKSKKFLGAVMRGTTKAVINAGVKKITGDDVDDFLDKLGTSDDALAGVFSSAAGEVFKAQEVAENSLEEFKEILTEHISTLENERLVVLVDELDRCRPNYAVEVLERIKHVFDVPGIIFVLLVDKDQLLNSISGVYGNKLDAEGYYRKFVDWDYKLPKPSNYSYIQHLAHEVYLLPSTLKNTSGGIFEYAHIAHLIAAFSDVYQLQLRDIDQLFTRINLTIQKGTKADSATLVFATALKFCEPSKYMKIARFGSDPNSGIYLLEKLFTELKESIFNSLPVTNAEPNFFAIQFVHLAAKSSRRIGSNLEHPFRINWFGTHYNTLHENDIHNRLTPWAEKATFHSKQGHLLEQLEYIDRLDF